MNKIAVVARPEAVHLLPGLAQLVGDGLRVRVAFSRRGAYGFAGVSPSFHTRHVVMRRARSAQVQLSGTTPACAGSTGMGGRSRK